MSKTLFFCELSHFGRIQYYVQGDPTLGLRIAHYLIEYVDDCYNPPMPNRNKEFPLFSDEVVQEVLYDHGVYDLLEGHQLSVFHTLVNEYVTNVCEFYQSIRFKQAINNQTPYCKHIELHNYGREVAFVY